MRFRLCFLGALLASGAHSGQAQTSNTFSLEYAAPATCPEKAQFVAAIADRAPDAREVVAVPANFRFVVHLESSGALARGTLSVEQQDGSRSLREVAEAPCSEVVESMALILSLILAGNESPPASGVPAPDGSAAAAAVAPAVAPAPAPSPTQPAAEPVPPKAPAPPPKQATRPARTPPVAPSVRPEVVDDAPDRERWRLGFPLGALAETGVAPSVAFGGQGGLDLWWVRDGFWSPSARLTARYVRSGLETTDYGSARFRLAALRAELCPGRWPAHSNTFGRVCVVVDAGQLQANPADAAQGETQTQTMPWLAGGGSLRLESMLADPLSLEAAADLTAVGRSDRFTFEPGAHTVHDVPTISAMFSLGVALRLP